MRPFFSVKKLCGLFFRHSKSIIFHLQINILILAVTPNMDLTLSVHKFHTIINSILKQRLKHQLYNTPIQNIFLYLKIHFKAVLISDLLDVHVISGMLDFILNLNHSFTLAQTDAEQTGKLRDHKYRIIISFTCDHPDNRIQCII